MDFVERCFLALTVTGFTGLFAAVFWMWVI